MIINTLNNSIVKKRTLYLTYVVAAAGTLDVSSDLPAGGAFLVGIRTNGTGFAIQVYTENNLSAADATFGITSVDQLITPVFATHCILYNFDTVNRRVNLFFTYWGVSFYVQLPQNRRGITNEWQFNYKPAWRRSLCRNF